MTRQSHWNRVYSTRSAEELSWFQEHPAVSIELIELASLGPSAAVIDVGGGDSLLVDWLLERGYEDLTVLDVSLAALERARRRLGNKGTSVDWVECDVTRWQPERVHDLWHDRAVFHFLTDAADRQRYIEVMERALRPGGRAIVATFSLEGPPKCSGLDVQRYSVETLAEELGGSFRLEGSREQLHQTPAGKSQAFIFTLFRKAV
ncbi:MAG: class I SAM-dependent methyltransferase [Rhodothermales bacterium]|nr:class I SAM-dependent methyltransferase [Rhodothermales bacterium]